MPCGLIVFDCHLLVVVVILIELVVSRSISIDREQRDLTTLSEKIMKKDRRHSIFDDKNRAILGELVSLYLIKSQTKLNDIFVCLTAYIFK
jgi:ribosomal protein S17